MTMTTTTKRERHDYRPTRLEALATCALERAGVEPYCDPLSIALGLGRTVRAVTRAEARATLVGNCLDYLWVQGATRETNMNIFWGDALIVFADAGIVRPSPGELALVAGFLALPARGVDPVDESGFKSIRRFGFCASTRNAAIGFGGPIPAFLPR